MRFTPGLARDRIELLRPTVADDGIGGPVTTFAAAGKRWAKRLRFQPTELERDDQRQGRADVQLLMRLDSLTQAVTTEWRLLFEGQELQVNGVDPMREHGTVTITGTSPRE